MPHTIRAMLASLGMVLILPCASQVMAADPAPGKDTPAAPAVERAPMLPRTQESALALESQLPAADQQQLKAGEDSFLALWKPANSNDPKGAVIIVPGADESANAPNIIGPMRQKFPDIGWSSLSITLPDQVTDYTPARAAEPAPGEASGADAKVAAKDAKPVEADPAARAEQEAAAETARAAAADEQAKAQAELIFARIESAIGFAQENKARSIIVLGHGTGAYWAARYLSERPAPLVQKFVMVMARDPALANPPLNAVVPTLKIKTADFIYKDQGIGRNDELERLQASKRNKGPEFRQIALAASPGNNPGGQEQIFRRVRGWVEAE